MDPISDRSIRRLIAGTGQQSRTRRGGRHERFQEIPGGLRGDRLRSFLVIFPSVTLRYRLSVDVDVDGVTHTGSGVVEFTYRPLPDSLRGISGGAAFGGDLRGYAITVDLGERGLLFVVNYSPTWMGEGRRPKDYANLSLLPFAAYSLPTEELASEMLGIARELKGKSGPGDLPLVKLPMIGRFEDINDQKSWFEELDLLNLATAYGADVRVTRVQFEFTNDPVTPMPQIWPAWLKADTEDMYTGGPPHLLHPSKSAFKGD